MKGKTRIIPFLLTGFLWVAGCRSNQEPLDPVPRNPPPTDPAYDLAPFTVSDPDLRLSPFTGMDRAQWKAAGIHI
jgi:hypothetical protein